MNETNPNPRRIEAQASRKAARRPHRHRGTDQGREPRLRQRQETLTAERAGLLQKNEQVRARVEAMIGRLKSMEQA